MTKEDKKIFIKIPTLYTERTTLRKITPDDILDVYEYASDPKVSKFLLWYPHPDKKYTGLYLKYIEKKYKSADFFDWGVEYEGKMIGTCGFTSFDLENNSAQIGYVLNRKYWGKGLGCECAKRVIQFGFEKLNLNRVYARYITENKISRSVMEKCNMKFEGVERQAIFSKGKYQDVGICSILFDEYTKLT